MSYAHVERDVPRYSSQRSGATVTDDPWPGYWIEVDLAERFSGARDRRAAHGTNAHFAQLNAQPFGTPTDPNSQPEPMNLQEPAA